MIRDHLVTAVKEVFPNLAFKISPASNPIISLSSSSPEIGDLHIYDDGDHATVIIAGITHGDFGAYDENLNTEEKEHIITEDVISFLVTLFSDRVVLCRTAMARSYPGATAVMEAGTHSPWVSRFLQELGLRVIVANPRKTREIYQNERKRDRRDARGWARLARMDPTLLHPIEHGSQEAQQDMLQLKLRDSLVRARVALINAVRFTLKSLGYAVSNPSSERFPKLGL